MVSRWELNHNRHLKLPCILSRINPNRVWKKPINNHWIFLQNANAYSSHKVEGSLHTCFASSDGIVLITSQILQLTLISTTAVTTVARETGKSSTKQIVQYWDEGLLHMTTIFSLLLIHYRCVTPYHAMAESNLPFSLIQKHNCSLSS